MRLYLIRHPRPAVAPGICYGRSDLPLAEDAAACAAGLASLLPAGLPLYSSPATRCRLLAEALHRAPIFDERLLELDFGDWEMKDWATIGRAAVDAWAADPFGFAPPGGESVAALRARVAAFLAELRGTAVLVSHGGVLRACAAELAQHREWAALPFEFGAVSLIEDGALVWKNRRHVL